MYISTENNLSIIINYNSILYAELGCDFTISNSELKCKQNVTLKITFLFCCVIPVKGLKDIIFYLSESLCMLETEDAGETETLEVYQCMCSECLCLCIYNNVYKTLCASARFLYLTEELPGSGFKHLEQ